MADSNAAFTALLEPWWDVFPSEYVVIHSKSDGVDLREHFYALELPLYEPTDDREATWRRYCEAMAIILLASPVDPTTYRWEIWDHCGIEEEYERQDYQLNMPSRLYVRLNDSIKYDLAWYLNAITTLLSPATERSDAISASRAALLEMAKEQQLGLEKVVIPVVVSLSFDDQKPIFPILERLIELQRRWLDDSAAGRSGMYLFYVERLELQVAWSFVSRGLVEAIEHYKASPGLQLHLIKHPPFAWMAPCSIVTKRTLLWRWAAATTGLPNASTVIPEDVLQASGVQLSGSHQLDVFGLTGESFPALFSSLMHSSDVHELVIRNSMLFPSIKDPSSKYKWCWLFYALFNEASSHSVTSLHIDDKDIVLEDLLTARDMTTSTDPLKMLINPEYDKLMNGSSLLSPTVELPPVQVTLRAGAQINIDPLQSPEGLIQTVQECTFDVVGQFRDGYGILVPGYGHCWVNHEDVTNKIKSSDDNSRNRWCFKTHSVKSLSISLNETHVEDDERGIKELLKLIGAPITQLTLTFSMGQALDQSYLDCVWTYCPRLDIFSFEYVEFDSLEGLIEVYASGRCRATVLSLPHCIIDDASSVIAFANALADPTTPIAMTLRQLRLTIIDHDEVDDMITHSTVCSFRDMLATNEHLDHLELWLSDDLYDVYEADFSDYDGEEMLLPLPLPAKCAFLSVVKHGQRHERKGSRDSTRALELIGRLDNLVISTIFQFAGESSLRSIALVAVSQSILAYDSRSSGHNWRWLFFALFNEAAHHAVTSLSISDTVVELADMETVNELVHSANPMEMLQFWFYEDNPSQSESTATSIAQVVLLNGAQVRLTPEHGPIVLAASSDGTKFDVMYAVDSGYAIFVPGYDMDTKRIYGVGPDGGVRYGSELVIDGWKMMEAVLPLLAPWWYVFPQGFLILSHDDEEMTTVVLEVPLCPAGVGANSTWQRWLEALALILLASLVDPTALLRMAKEHCYHNKLLFAGVESVSWRLRLVVANDQFAALHPHWPLKALRTLLSHNFECSMEYKTARMALLQLIKCPKRRNECDDAVFPVIIYLTVVQGDEKVASMLNRIVALNATKTTTQSTRWFVLDAVELRFLTVSYSTGLSRSMEQLAAEAGVRLRSVAFGGSAKQNESDAIQQWMRSVSGCGAFEGAQKVTVAGLGDEEFVQFCASLVGSKGVRTLRLTKVLTSPKGHWNPAHRWAWLLYVLFNPSSRLSVTSVEISDDDILVSDIKAIYNGESAVDREDESSSKHALQPDRAKTHPCTWCQTLLDLVGWPLTHLNLSLMLIGTFDASYLSHVWQCCPNLERLEMDSLAMDSLHPLVDAYASSKCHVSSLELTRCVLSDQSSVFDLTQALEDSALVITKTLRHLVLHLGRHTVSISDEMLTAFLSMLQVNQRLRHVVLFVSNDQQTRFASRFRALIAHIPQPLSLSAKCAFLSVVRLTHNKAMSRLDSRVVSQIFSLAAETEPRTVVLHVY
ncbi:hypothetical protein Poli38472_013728 [Pythium oligandrum]|uniref:Uncharacterized protein n=1 Tax=Pythium oligandrum TaxID=41045 RepID=A0A8K1CED7_PYTOL|nr:hypothetical protein Poli38472_013728 [Pythium oligandrum]|eukprot:TMW61265.1 hypothetical protein Poli38472_013728 [Pythium oligandrum]